MLRLSQIFIGAALSLAAASSQAAESCALKQVASADAKVTPGGQLLIAARIGDTPVWWQIDTGAAVSILGQAAAMRLGLFIEQGRTHVYGFDGKDIDKHTRLPELKLGNLVSRNEVFPVTPYGGDGSDELPIGLFGADYLRNYDVEIDMDHGKVNLFSTDHCRGKVVYWAAQYNAAPFHLTDQNRIELDATLDGQTIISQIDTGSDVTYLSSGAARRYFGMGDSTPGLEEAGKVHGIDGSSESAYKYPFKTLVLAGLTIHNPIIRITPFSEIKDFAKSEHLQTRTQPDIYVGMDLIPNFTATSPIAKTCSTTRWRARRRPPPFNERPGVHRAQLISAADRHAAVSLRSPTSPSPLSQSPARPRPGGRAR